MTKLTFGLDYDGTYSADHRVWDTFIDRCTLLGHKVVIVTYRDERYDWNSDLEYFVSKGLQVYCTRGVAKAWFMTHFGENVDIWIDDKPYTLYENSKATPESLEEWRTRNEETLSDRVAS